VIVPVVGLEQSRGVTRLVLWANSGNEAARAIGWIN
jgi:hypothetical protein